MTMTMSNLPEDLVVEILSRVPMTSVGSVRSTCKKWNILSKNWIIGKIAKGNNQFVGFMTKSKRICSVRIDLQGIRNDGDGFIDQSIKLVRNEVEVQQLYHCDGLLLLSIVDSPRLMVWNPYLGQRRLIPPIFNSFRSFALGYDNNRSYKILLVSDFYINRNSSHFFRFNIHVFTSDSWRVLDLTPNWKIRTNTSCVTLKGNAYFYAQEDINLKRFLLCFDFTSERFGPHLSLPFHCDCFYGDNVILSSVRDKQLALLYQAWTRMDIMEIWVTNKIEYNEMLWTKWMRVDLSVLVDFPFSLFQGSFFIEEEKKVAVVFNTIRKNQGCYTQTAQIFGEDLYIKSVNIGEYKYPIKPEVVGYYPSLVQIQ